MKEDLNESSLTELITKYNDNKTNLDRYKKEVENLNQEIKIRMKDLGVDEFATDDGITAKIIISHKESFIDEKLLQKVKTYNIENLVKT